MTETKYARNIITKFISDEELISRGRTPNKREPGVPFSNGVLWLDEKIIKDAFYMEVCLVGPGTKSTGEMVKPHIHECDEIIGFVGTSVENPGELGGEAEIWLEDEKHILTKTCMVYVPAGLKHCPLSFEKVSHPIVHYSVMTGKQYLWTYV